MKLLDLFCGAGGCSVGYARAGFDVVGVDIAVQPHYPLAEIHQADALDVLRDRDYCQSFDVIHASPPCQAYTALRTRTGRKDYPDLVGAVQDLLFDLDVPYVIENVVGAPLLDPIMLCGSMFGLGIDGAKLRRHRLFEVPVPIGVPPDDCGDGVPIVGVYGTGGGWTRIAPGGGGVKVSGARAAEAMGVDWTTNQAVLSQMIPPAYTEHIGRWLIYLLEMAA